MTQRVLSSVNLEFGGESPAAPSPPAAPHVPEGQLI